MTSQGAGGQNTDVQPQNPLGELESFSRHQVNNKYDLHASGI